MSTSSFIPWSVRFHVLLPCSTALRDPGLEIESAHVGQLEVEDEARRQIELVMGYEFRDGSERERVHAEAVEQPEK
jgi:hypothetical protein